MLKFDISKYDPRTYILIKGARMHNLKNIDLAIPKNKLVVITGLSGSGKSSLAFDTLFADGQRRYVESLSAYARQFLGRMSKPDVDFIKGIAPAIAIEQKVNTRNPRSTVGTSTEIYEYLKLLFARIGITYSPVSGALVQRHTVTNVTDFVLGLPADSKVLIYVPLTTSDKKRSVKDQLSVRLQQGFSRVIHKNEIKRIDDLLAENTKVGDELFLVIDRVIAKPGDEELRSRVADSIQTAFFEGSGHCYIEAEDNEGKKTHSFSNKFEADGIEFEEPSENLFSFNNPFGACKKCEGFGSVIGIDPDLVIPNKSLSVYEEAIVCWKGEKMSEWKDVLVKNAYKFDFPIHKPIYELTPQQYELLWTGNSHFYGLNDFFKYVEEQTYKIQYRVMLSRYRGKTICPDCKGTRLRKDAGYVKINGRSINEIVLMPVGDVNSFFNNIELSDHEFKVAKRLLIEIKNRLQVLIDVGLGYLTLNRLSNTLSGGESQRINLATSLGSSLVGSLYILDEPSIGLHPRDTHRLIKVLKQLRDAGNTVIIVEHDEEIIKAADEIIDIGPAAGIHGGELVFQGKFDELSKSKESFTAKYMTGGLKIDIPNRRRKWKNHIEILGARENNLKGINVKFPLNTFTCITGVSGSGKTSLIKHILYPVIRKMKGGYGEKTGKYGKLEGDYQLISHIELVDQNPIGRSSRSNPATYVKAYDDIRSLYASQQLAKVRGYKPGYFSFNVEGGRCEECEGEGVVKIEMQFMADIYLKCESCDGKRFKDEVLDVKFHGKDINDVLNMTINQAIDFFGTDKKATASEHKIVEKLMPLQDVGLGYLGLGQSSSTLSGGEAQRVKLALFLSKGANESPTLFIFDEPTTGLHFHDISNLLKAFDALIEKGHSVLVIEHNTDVIKYADWVIDLGPEGGEKGGSIVFEGTPEDLAKQKSSYTGQFLKEKFS
ncbi:MAG TPA: excinuclease ABC subunit UvrA [Bacteroidales bacterium]|nr:excinuclease ABC subunit UvrA [Bacteroidales bacterium]HPE58310.1 excinuclease ABC subunit UvrA [Bacteroidales bacterium]HRX98221.1 excinuclease ABC subunit UvrA [Bacteroidales bacterium]